MRVFLFVVDKKLCLQDVDQDSAFNTGATFHLEVDRSFPLLFKPPKLVGFGDTSVSKREGHSLPLSQKYGKRVVNFPLSP